MNGFDFDFSTLEKGTLQDTGSSVEVEQEITGNKEKVESPNPGIEYIENGTLPEVEVDEEEDEPSKEVESQDEQKDPSSDDTDDASGSFALAFAKFQQEEGFISELGEEEITELKEVESTEGKVGVFKYLLEKQRDSIYEEAKATYGTDQAELVEYFELKDAGVNADLAKELAFQKKQFTSIDETDLEDEDLRKKVIAQHYKLTTNFPDAKIKKLVENSVSLGEDEEEAKEALVELKKINEAQIKNAKLEVQKQQEAQANAAKEYKENLKKHIYSVAEIIEGQKINKPTQQKIEKMLLEPVKDNNGNVTNGIWAERAKDPKAFDTKLAYFLISGVFDGKLDKTVKSKTKTKVVNEFEDFLSTKGAGIKGKPVEKGGLGDFSPDEFFK